MACRKYQREEENRQKKNIEKWRVRKTKNTKKFKQQQYISLVLNYILLENIIWKEVVYTIKFYLQLLCAAGYLKHSNDNIYNSNDKYSNYNIIETYINRLNTTTQIFIAIDYLIMMSEKYLYFRKRKKHLARTLFTHPREVTGSMYFGNIFRIMYLPKIT